MNWKILKELENQLQNLLLKEFKSVKNIQTKPREELAKIIGLSKAKMITGYFIGESENEE
ncbi:MAG: hypothetical protein WKG06_08155 [Segetibacter sp.]